MLFHRDIASRNCLITLNKVTKLGDFGLTRKVGDGTDYYRYQKMGKDKHQLLFSLRSILCWLCIQGFYLYAGWHLNH